MYIGNLVRCYYTIARHIVIQMSTTAISSKSIFTPLQLVYNENSIAAIGIPIRDRYVTHPTLRSMHTIFNTPARSFTQSNDMCECKSSFQSMPSELQFQGI